MHESAGRAALESTGVEFIAENGGRARAKPLERQNENTAHDWAGGSALSRFSENRLEDGVRQLVRIEFHPHLASPTVHRASVVAFFGTPQPHFARVLEAIAAVGFPAGDVSVAAFPARIDERTLQSCVSHATEPFIFAMNEGRRAPPAAGIATICSFWTHPSGDE